MEEWKDIEGYEGLYKVSSFSRIKSLKRIVNNNGGIKILKERVLKGRKINNRYLSVSLCKDGKQKTYLIHRLVAQAFIPNPDNKPYVDHINTNIYDNRVENLRWCTQKENCNNPLTKIKHINSIKVGKLNPNSKEILQFSLNGDFIRKWDCIADVKRNLEYHTSSISNCCLCNRKTAYGYKWKYYDFELYLESKLFKVYGIKNKKVA